MSPAAAPAMSPALQALARRLGRSLQAALAVPQDLVPPLRVPRADPPIAPALLAQSQPSARARQESQAMYARCLAHCREQLRPGTSDDDAGELAAAFVLANLDAWHGTTSGEAQWRAVERQMRHLLSRAWPSLSLQERQSACEQWAVLATLVAQSTRAAATQGAAARTHVQRAARAYLVQWLGVDADRLRATPQGLQLDLQGASA